MIKVCGHRLLVKPILLEETDDVFKSARSAGIVIQRDDRAREHESVDQGVVIQIGPTAWQLPEHGGQAWCQVNDTVVYAKFAGKLIVDPVSKEKYIALNDEDIVAVLTKEENE